MPAREHTCAIPLPIKPASTVNSLLIVIFLPTLFQKISRNNHSLDLTGPFKNAIEPNITKELFNSISGRVSLCAKDVHGHVVNATGHFSAKDFYHRILMHKLFTYVAQLGGMVEHLICSVNASHQVSQRYLVSLWCFLALFLWRL